MNHFPIASMVLIGAGNIGTHLGPALRSSGIRCLQVFSRSYANAKCLADRVGAKPIIRPEEVTVDADLWLIAIRDDAIESLVARLPAFNGIVAHTSGSVPIGVLSRYALGGVFYPFQTFSRSVALDLSHVPVLVEGCNDQTTNELLDLAGKISRRVVKANSEQRARLHLAAVLSCNFVNHLYALSDALLEEHDLSFDLLKPLIEETTRKALTTAPAEAQTGPAVRNDREVLGKQMEVLSDNLPLQEIYRLLSRSILSMYGHGDDKK